MEYSLSGLPNLNPQPSMALLNTTFPKSGEKYRVESSVSSSPELHSSIDTAVSSFIAFPIKVSFSGAAFADLFSKTSVVKRAAVMAFTYRRVSLLLLNYILHFWYP